LDDLSLDFESKSRKSSGYSTSNGGDAVVNGKIRQYSGYDPDNKSRQSSGNSITAGITGILSNGGTAPVMIPGSTNMSPKGGSPLMQSTLANGIINEQNGTGDNVSDFFGHDDDDDAGLELDANVKDVGVTFSLAFIHAFQQRLLIEVLL